MELYNLPTLTYTLKSGSYIFTNPKHKNAPPGRLEAELIANVPIVAVSDFAGDVAGGYAASLGLGCGPLAIVCVPALYVTANIGVNYGVDAALDWGRDKILDHYYPEDEEGVKRQQEYLETQEDIRQMREHVIIPGAFSPYY